MMKLGITLALFLLGTNELVAESIAGRAYTWTEERPIYNTTLRDQLNAARVTEFLSYIDKAGLGYLLDGKEFYTIFAPSNHAFDKMAKDPSCQQEYEKGYDHYNKDQYRPTSARYLRPTILKQMILGRYNLINLRASNGALIPSKTDAPVSILAYGDTVVVNGGKIVKGNLHASNGVVHVVDSIHCLQMDSSLDVLRSYSDANGHEFVNALDKANLLPWVQFGQSVTILVPRREEIQELLYGRGQYGNQRTGYKLQEFVKSRVLFGLYYPENLRYLPYVRSIFGRRLHVVRRSAEEVLIDGYPVHLSNIKVTRNGVIYFPNKYAIYNSNTGRSYGSAPPTGGGYGGPQVQPPYMYPMGPPPFPPPPPPQQQPQPSGGRGGDGGGEKKGLLGNIMGMLGGLG